MDPAGPPGVSLSSVLLVEDQPHTRELLGEFIAHAGYRVDLAASAEEALTVLENGALPSLIVMDLHLPGMDGWQLHGLLSQDPRWARIPVVVTTAAVRHTPPPLGVAHLLPKPIDLRALASLLVRYCGEVEEPAA